MKSFFSSAIPEFENKITETEFDKWLRIQTHLNVFGPYGYLYQNKEKIAGDTESLTKRYLQNKKIVIPDKLIQHFLYGKTLFISGMIGGTMQNFDIQLCVDNLSTILKLESELNCSVFNVNNKHYLSINVDVDCAVWEMLEKFVYKFKKTTGLQLAIRGKPAYLKTTVVDNEHYYRLCYDSNLLELDRNLLKDSVFERFMYRSKLPISKLVEYVADCPEDYAFLERQEYLDSISDDFVKFFSGESGGETIKLNIDNEFTSPEPDLENLEPCARCGHTSDGALAESEKSVDISRDFISASAKASAEQDRGGPASYGSLEVSTSKNSLTNNSFIVSPPPEWQLQLSTVYRFGTNNQDRFCYSEVKEGIKKPKVRKRYLTESKFVSYSMAIINSCLFSKDNYVSIDFVKSNFVKLQSQVKWTNDDFYYVRDLLLDIGIIVCVSTSYRVGHYGKKYEFENGSLSRFCYEGMQYKFPVAK